MHLGRFHFAIDLLAGEFKKVNQPQLIANIVSALSSAAANPGNPDIAQAYKNQLESCRSTLAGSAFNHPRPVLKTLLESIGAQDFVGDRLFARVMSALNANPVAPSLAAQELQRLQEQAQKFFANVTALDNAFSALEVEYDFLEEGEGELGLVLPRLEGNSTLKELSKEFREWGNTLAPISEVFDPEAGPLQIRTCATTDLTIFLAATPPILAGIALCLKGVNAILRELVEGRELIEKLLKRNAPKEAIEVLEADSKSKLDNEIRRLAEEIVDAHFQKDDQARKNELKNAMDVSLKQLAHKVTHGAKLEMRLVPHERPSETDASPDEVHVISEAEQKMEELAAQFDNDVQLLNFSTDVTNVAALLDPPALTDEEAA